MVFVLAVLLTARFTEGYFYGMFASVVSVFGVNFAFTYPYFEFNFSLTGYPLTFLSMFAVSMVVGMLTERVKRQDRIKSEAEKEKMKANLLRSVSHDLRTPLTSIIGSANVVLEHYDTLSDDEKKELVGHVRDDAQWLVRLVENILSITRIKDNAVQLKKAPEMAEEIIAEAVAKFRKNRSMPVRVTLPEEMLMIPMDATLIEQVLINLMENVVIHAENATQINVSIERTSLEEVCFCVEDNGEGIDEKILPKLFEELFPHAKESHADGRRSMGIGLSACMSIVKAHGGNMHAKNKPDGGACVYFALPMEEEMKNGG
jgi:two-component system sensor histidine kinase KdpD